VVELFYDIWPGDGSVLFFNHSTYTGTMLRQEVCYKGVTHNQLRAFSAGRYVTLLCRRPLGGALSNDAV